MQSGHLVGVQRGYLVGVQSGHFGGVSTGNVDKSLKEHSVRDTNIHKNTSLPFMFLCLQNNIVVFLW